MKSLSSYLVAVGLVAAATFLRSLLDPWVGDSLPYITYFAAIVAAAWFGRLGPSLFAVVLSCITAEWFFIPPRYSFKPSYAAPSDWVGLVTFLIVGAILASLSESLHRARQSASTRREWLRVALNSIGDAVMATDAQGIVLLMNPVAEELTGWKSAEARGRRLNEVFRIINERTRQAVEDPGGKVLATGRIVGLANHTVLLARDGTERPIDDSAAPIKNEFGEILGVVLVFRDATKQRLAQENAERLTAIVEHSNDAIIGKDLQGIITSWNAAAERLYGFTSQEAVGQPISKIVPADRQAELKTIMERLVGGEPIEHLETVRVKRDGTRIDISLTVSPIKNAYGEVVGASKIARDISQRKRAQEALRISEARKSAFFRSALDCIISIDHDGRVVEFNPAAEDTFGYREEEAVGKELASLIIPPAVREQLRRGLAHYLATGEAPVLNRRLEMMGWRSDNTEFPVELTVTRVQLDGAPVFTAHLRDISERKQLENQLRQYIADLSEADRRKDEFLAMLAHELRNPLAAIGYAMQLLSTSPEQLSLATEITQRQVRQLTHLIDDLLDVSRITTNRIQLRKEAIDAGVVVSRAVGSARSAIEERSQKLAVDISHQQMPLFADPTRIEQVIVNLLVNAAKYTPEGGDISVKAYPENEHVVIKVRDAGVGIPREMLTRVFELFTQVEPTIDRAAGGLGIGLTVVRHLTEMHGGTVSAASEGLGKGSEFSVHLPLSSIRGASATPTAAPTIKPGLKVLVVEDNVDTARTLSLLLQGIGCTTKAVHDGPPAVGAAKEFQPDAILLDIGLPGLDGYHIARLIRQTPELSHIRLIAVTGYGQQQDRERSRKAGFDDHLVKPVQFNSLVEALAVN
ncbi:MAG TPA: PAS domain S-box protein [Lacipirellulaceae bacterium]|nr:PAS domain S-box protein [Lacipirellulaceae bacterium]